MSASMVGSLVLIVAGLGFLAAAVVAYRRVRTDPDRHVTHRLGLGIDVLVGLVALGDGTLSTVGAPDRVVVWSIGTAALVVVVTLLLVHRHQSA